MSVGASPRSRWRLPGIHRGVDWLEGELQASEWRLGFEESNRHHLEVQRINLINEVVSLEAATRASARDAHRWRSQALDLEKTLVTTAARADGAIDELNESNGREKAAALLALNRGIEATEAQNQLLSVLAEVAEQQQQIQQLELELTSRKAKADVLSDEMAAVAKAHTTLQTQHEQLKTQSERYRAEQEAQHETLCEANRKNAALQAQVEDLERRLLTSLDIETELLQKVSRLEAEREKLTDSNFRLRLDLQEVVSQATRAGEVPFYVAGAQHSPSMRVPSKPPAQSPPSSARAWQSSAHHEAPIDDQQEGGERPPSAASSPTLRSRRFYPRSAHVVASKASILEARSKALDKIDALKA